jgi:hypothetical protein
MNIGVATLGRYESGITDVPMGIAEKMAILYNVSFEDIRQAVGKTRIIKIEI